MSQVRISAPRVLLQQVGGVTLAANRSVLMRFRGTALKEEGSDYCTVEVQNEADAYALPSV